MGPWSSSLAGLREPDFAPEGCRRYLLRRLYQDDCKKKRSFGKRQRGMFRIDPWSFSFAGLRIPDFPERSLDWETPLCKRGVS